MQLGTWCLLASFRKHIALIKPKISRQHLIFLINNYLKKKNEKTLNISKSSISSQKRWKIFIFFYFPFSSLFTAQGVFHQEKYHFSQTDWTEQMLYWQKFSKYQCSTSAHCRTLICFQFYIPLMQLLFLIHNSFLVSWRCSSFW